jgi:hypothetical protein
VFSGRKLISSSWRIPNARAASKLRSEMSSCSPSRSFAFSCFAHAAWVAGAFEDRE